MNVRDPFNRNRTRAFDILRGTAINTAIQLTQVIEAGTQAYDTGRKAVEEMAFSGPNNPPSFVAPQREVENRAWASSGVTARSAATHTNGGVIGNVQDRVGDFFKEKKGDLPMYKDKPYSYAASRRQRPLWKQKRTWGVAGIFGLIILYTTGFFGGHSDRKEKLSWNWSSKHSKGASKVDWFERRDQVKEAFTLSWDAYERYAWGMLVWFFASWMVLILTITQAMMNIILSQSKDIRWFPKAWVGLLSMH